MTWLKTVDMPAMLRETLDEYLLTLAQLTDKILYHIKIGL